MSRGATALNNAQVKHCPVLTSSGLGHSLWLALVLVCSGMGCSSGSVEIWEGLIGWVWVDGGLIQALTSSTVIPSNDKILATSL